MAGKTKKLKTSAVGISLTHRDRPRILRKSQINMTMVRMMMPHAAMKSSMARSDRVNIVPPFTARMQKKHHRPQRCCA